MSSILDFTWHQNKLIEIFGQTITIYRYTIEVDENGIVTNEECYETITTKGWITPLTGLMEVWEIVGYRIEGDYSICIPNTVQVSTQDKVRLPDNTIWRIRSIVKHFDINNVAYLELIVGRESGEIQ